MEVPAMAAAVVAARAPAHNYISNEGGWLWRIRLHLTHRPMVAFVALQHTASLEIKDPNP